MKSESLLTKLFKSLKLDSIAWSFRRWHVPVGKNDLVLEIGSGGNPYFRSNILCDADLRQEDKQRELINDRPLVICEGERLPFKDDSFDFSIASYVFEHITNPNLFLDEIQRVSKGGFIEVPDAFREKFTAVPYHRLEVSYKNNELLIRKKPGVVSERNIHDLLNSRQLQLINSFTAKHPFSFQIRYYWNKEQGGIKYRILNPEYEYDWEKQYQKKEVKDTLSLTGTIKQKILQYSRILLSQSKRNREINIFEILQCPYCNYNDFKRNNNGITCQKCSKTFPILINNTINFIN